MSDRSYARIADELRTRVREWGLRDVRTWLVGAMRRMADAGTPADWVGLAVELAMAVPDSVPLEDLTAWSRGGAGADRWGPTPHGTVAGAHRHRRRRQKPCEACLAAERVALRRRRARARAAPRSPQPMVDAGLVAAVVGGRKGRMSIPEKQAAARRLAELGLSVNQIADQVGSDPRTVQRWLPQCDGRAGDTDVDEARVQRAMSGERVALSVAERREAVRRLTDKGMGLSEIADRLHTTSRSVARHRAALRRVEGEAA